MIFVFKTSSSTRNSRSDHFSFENSCAEALQDFWDFFVLATFYFCMQRKFLSKELVRILLINKSLRTKQLRN